MNLIGKVYSIERFRYYLFLSFFTLLCLPIFIAIDSPESWSLGLSNLPSLAKYLSSVLGYIGIALLTIQLILGTRTITALIFDDLSSKLSLHSKLGKYGTVFIFLHPLLISYYYAEKFYIFSFSIGSEFERNVTLGRLAFVGLLIIWLSSAVLKSKIKYRPWKYMHYLSYPVLVLSLLHVPQIGSNFGEYYVRIFWYVVVSIVLICTALRMRHIFGFSKKPYEVLSNKHIGQDIWVLEMRAENKDIKVNSGQYVYIQPNLLSEEHPFSVLNHNLSNRTIVIAYKIYGRFTKKLKELKNGDRLFVDGAYGTFTEELSLKPIEPAVFIAGGIGITPFVKHCINNHADHYLFYAVRNKASAVFLNVLKPVLKDRLVLVCSDENVYGTNEESGFVTKEIIKKYIKNVSGYHYYICGPEQMMKSVNTELKLLSIADERLHKESFSFLS